MNRKNDAEAEARFRDRMQALRVAYADRQLEMIRDVLRAYDQLTQSPENSPESAEALNALIFTAHSLAGSAGTFEYEDIARTAIALEDEARRLRDGADGDNTILKKQTDRLKGQLQDLEDSVQN